MKNIVFGALALLTLPSLACAQPWGPPHRMMDTPDHARMQLDHAERRLMRDERMHAPPDVLDEDHRRLEWARRNFKWSVRHN